MRQILFLWLMRAFLYGGAHEEYLGVFLRYILNYERVGGHLFLGHLGPETLKKMSRFLCCGCFVSRAENILED